MQASLHAYDELAARGIFFDELVAGIGEAIEIEDYPEAFKGRSVLALHRDAAGLPVHVVWGIPKGQTSPAVMVTAYRPDPAMWSMDFTKRSRS